MPGGETGLLRLADGKKNGAAAIDDSIAVAQKIKHSITTWYSNSISAFIHEAI